MSTYGKRGGRSITAGRKAETIKADFGAGIIRQKRVYFGQRALTLVADESGELVQAWPDLKKAQTYLSRISREDYPVQLAAVATAENKSSSL